MDFEEVQLKIKYINGFLTDSLTSELKHQNYFCNFCVKNSEKNKAERKRKKKVTGWRTGRYGPNAKPPRGGCRQTKEKTDQEPRNRKQQTRKKAQERSPPPHPSRHKSQGKDQVPIRYNISLSG